MIDLATYDKSPKHVLGGWKSEKYRKWLRDNANCIACQQPLTTEKEAYEPHHHLHARNNDGMYLTICLACHNKLHFSEKSKEDWMRRFGLNERSFERYIILALTSYLLKLGGFNTMVNVLSELAKELE